MFSSNQQLVISGDIDQLKKSLKFALKHSGWYENFKDDLQPTVQITDGHFCIGWGSPDEDEPMLISDTYSSKNKGWGMLPFAFNYKALYNMVKQWLSEQDIEKSSYEGSNTKGFIIKAIECREEDIQDPEYGIISIAPFNCFYGQ